MRRKPMRCTTGLLAAVLAGAALALGSEAPPARKPSARGILAKALRMVRGSPEDPEENIKILTAALRRISEDKRYRRIIAYELHDLRARWDIPIPEGEDPAKACKDAMALRGGKRREDYVGNAEKLRYYVKIVAGTRYEKRVRAFLEEQEQKAKEADGKRERKYELADIEDDVRAHPERHYVNTKLLEETVKKYADLAEVESTKELLEQERAMWDLQRPEWEREIRRAEEVIKLQPKEHEANIQMLEAIRQKVADTPLERRVSMRLAQLKRVVSGGTPAEEKLSEEEMLLRFVAEVMLRAASTPEMALASRLGEETAHEAVEKKQTEDRLKAIGKKPTSARELRKAAEAAAALPGGRDKAVELYERAGAMKDPVHSPRAWKDLGRLLASLPLKEYPRSLRRKRRPDSWRYALACFDKAKKLDPAIATEELALDEGRVCAELAEHFREKGEPQLEGSSRERAKRILKPLGESQNEKVRNAALKTLVTLEESR